MVWTPEGAYGAGAADPAPPPPHCPTCLEPGRITDYAHRVCYRGFLAAAYGSGPAVGGNDVVWTLAMPFSPVRSLSRWLGRMVKPPAAERSTLQRPAGKPGPDDAGEYLPAGFW